ncbi:hypothetical protein BEP19_08510 [Ammoniphilus oxalaticus]|uniref:MurNAc-LAA domain-containing protein n=1 Tax=Ammoniphilus oxalaticus TaxID=66863 RepID=A0A419SKD9_9BACL|nr:N-acetylmuramoyl-L-alanine amidase [Ammoniphilus oxalaticus]RKD24420.1 hypothetical protein BEP19_08510 [Ammoniphilus oxalaticus]
MALIILDPGHGGHDGGARGYGLVEKDLTLRIGLKVRDSLLQRYLVEVKMTRETDTFISLSGRAEFANRLNADYFVSLHHNAAGGEGFESYVYRGTTNNVTIRRQQILHQEIMNYLRTLGVRDRGTKQANFAVLRQTKMPAILLENLFLDHPLDAELLKNPVVLNQLSHSVATGIAKAFDLQERNPAPTLTPQPPTPTPIPPPEQPDSPDWKDEAVDWMLQEGLLTHADWKKSLENPLPLWAFAVVLKRLYEKME